MSTIRTIYSAEPSFPATDQHPDAVRYRVGDYWVDAIDGEPTQDEIDAILNPAQEPVRDPLAELDALRGELVSKAVLSKAEADATAMPAQGLSESAIKS